MCALVNEVWILQGYVQEGVAFAWPYAFCLRSLPSSDSGGILLCAVTLDTAYRGTSRNIGLFPDSGGIRRIVDTAYRGTSRNIVDTAYPRYFLMFQLQDVAFASVP